MSDVIQEQLKGRYMAAVESFVDKVKSDPNVIAVVVCGSLSYDVVWDKSDIDITVIIRDQPLTTWNYCIIEDGITLSIELGVRSGIKRFLERSLGGSFGQSYYANAKIVYTTDDSLYEYFEDIKTIGADDIPLSAMMNAASLLAICKKSRKWLLARKDPLYAQYWLIMAAEFIAKMELCVHGLPFNRDGIKKALEVNPELLRPYYQDAMSRIYSGDDIMAAINKVNEYLNTYVDLIKEPVIDFLSGQEMQTMTMINKHFKSSGDALVYVLDWLAEKEIIQKVSKTIRLTPKSKASVEEIGYLYV